MADRKNFYFEQRVTQAELDDAFADLENAEFNIKKDAFSGIGFLMSAVTVTEDSPQSESVLVGDFLGWDDLGQRVEKTTGPTAFSFSGDHGTNIINATLYAKFDRAESDARTDGNGATVNFEREESFVIERDLGPDDGSQNPPTLRTDGSIPIATVLIPAGSGNITNSEITTTIQSLQSQFPFERMKDSSKDLEDAILGAKTAGADGSDRIAILSDITVTVDRFAQGYQGEVKILTDRAIPATRIDIEFCRVVDGTNTHLLALGPGSTILDATVAGALNGLDAGALAPNTWYYIFAIADSAGANQGGLISLSSTAPTLPGTHTGGFRRRIGCVRTDGAANFINFRQIDNEVYYEEEHLVASGAPNAPLALVSVATRVPPIAERGIFFAYRQQLVAGGDTLFFGDGGHPTPPATVIKFRLVGGSSSLAGDTADFKLHVDATQQVYWAKNPNINVSELYVRGFILDNKEG